MKRNASKLVLGVVVALAMAACGSEGPSADLTNSSTTLTEGATQTTLALGETQPDEEMAATEPTIVEQQAIEDLSDRLGVSPEDIETVSVESGVWSDGSIGCPQPDMMYTQALVPGHRVILAHDGDTYSYHQGGSQPVFLCEEPAEGAFTGAEGDQLIPPPGFDE